MEPPFESLSAAEIKALAVVFHEPASAMSLLEAAGISRDRQPSWHASTSAQFWSEVSACLGAGVIADGRARVLGAAAALFPAHPVFAPAADEPGSDQIEDVPPPPPDKAGPHSHVDARHARGLVIGDGARQTNIFNA